MGTHTCSGGKLVHQLWKIVCRLLRLKIEPSHDQAIPLLSIYLKEVK